MIPPDLAGVLQAGLAIHLGTRDGQLAPAGARALAVSVARSGDQLTVFLSRPAAAHVLPHLEAHRQAAVVFVRPVDDWSCQVKGTFLDARPARATERALVSRQWEGFLDGLERIGIPRTTTGGWATWPATAIRLQPTALFDQTPGPNAGRPWP